MTTFYSPHFTNETPSSTTDAVAAANPAIKVAAGFRHATLRHTHALINLTSATLADEDDIRMFTMKSGDRLIELPISIPAAWAATTLTLHLGLYEAGDNHDGPVIDDDLFNSALDGAATTSRVDQFTLGVLEDEDRGKALWELANEGDGTYTEDPHELWDVVIHIDALSTVTVQDEILLEAVYKSGGN